MLHPGDLQGICGNAARKTTNSASLSDRTTPDSLARMKLLPSGTRHLIASATLSCSWSHEWMPSSSVQQARYRAHAIFEAIGSYIIHPIRCDPTRCRFLENAERP